MNALRRILPVLAGAGIGYGYYAIVGCATGTCPITSNPWVSTLYGAAIGWIIVPGSRKGPMEKDTIRKEQQ